MPVPLFHFLSICPPAAALDDGGYAAEVLLLKYPECREFWHVLRDTAGFLPSDYARASGNDHLDMLAIR